MHDVTLALNIASITTLLKFLDEEPKGVNQEIQTDMEGNYCMKLRAISAKSTQVEFKTPRIRRRNQM